MTRPATQTYALVAWRAKSLTTIGKLRRELDLVEELVHAGETGRVLALAVENAWDAAGFISGIMLGPETSEEERAEFDAELGA